MSRMIHSNGGNKIHRPKANSNALAGEGDARLDSWVERNMGPTDGSAAIRPGFPSWGDMAR
jgi:hypothetical protein